MAVLGENAKLYSQLQVLSVQGNCSNKQPVLASYFQLHVQNIFLGLRVILKGFLPCIASVIGQQAALQSPYSPICEYRLLWQCCQ